LKKITSAGIAVGCCVFDVFIVREFDILVGNVASFSLANNEIFVPFLSTLHHEYTLFTNFLLVERNRNNCIIFDGMNVLSTMSYERYIQYKC